MSANEDDTTSFGPSMMSAHNDDASFVNGEAASSVGPSMMSANDDDAPSFGPSMMSANEEDSAPFSGPSMMSAHDDDTTASSGPSMMSAHNDDASSVNIQDDEKGVHKIQAASPPSAGSPRRRTKGIIMEVGETTEMSSLTPPVRPPPMSTPSGQDGITGSWGRENTDDTAAADGTVATPIQGSGSHAVPHQPRGEPTRWERQ
jgi:hypothetical protein